MVSAHIASFLKLISAQLEETSRGIKYHRRVRDWDIGEDADRLRATHVALAGFRFAVEHSQPNSRVRRLGLA